MNACICKPLKPWLPNLIVIDPACTQHERRESSDPAATIAALDAMTPRVCDACAGAGVLPTDHIDDLSACPNCLGRGRM